MTVNFSDTNRRSSFRPTCWVGLLGLALLVQNSAAQTWTGPVESPRVVRVKATALMVRQGPSTSEPILTHLDQGQEFVATARSSNGWHMISLPDGTPGEERYGWISGAFVDVNPSSAGTVVQVNGPLLAQVGAASLRVRSGPGTSFGEVTKVWGGQSFVAFGTPTRGEGSTQPWYKIHLPACAGATEGWIAGDYLSLAGPEPAPTPTAPAPTAVTLPTLSSFTVQPTTVAAGEPVSVSFTVTAATGLGRVALLRTAGDGLETDPGWTEVIATNLASFGRGPVRLLFSDSTAPAGIYWYDVKVWDSATPAPHSINARQAGVGPRLVIVQPQKDIPAPAPAPPPQGITPPATNRVPETTAPKPDETSLQLTRVQAEVAALQSEKQAWQREKTALDGRIQQLSAQLTNAAPAPVPVPSVDPNRLQEVENDRQELRKKLTAVEKVLAASRDEAGLQLDEAQAKVTALQSEKQAWQREKATLDGRVQQLAAQLTNATPPTAPVPSVDPDRLKQLESERQELRTKLAAAEKALATCRDEANLQLTRAQAQVAALQSEKQTWQREKATLDGRVQQLAAQLTNAAPAPVPVPSVDPDRLKQLEDERQDLRTKLAAAEKALASRVKDLETRITVLQARLAVYEAPAVPFTAEELALFKTPVPTQPNPLREPQTLTPPTAEVAALLTEARGFVGKRQLDRAEAKFREVLQRDSTNVEALSKLGAIQLDLHRPAEAEPNLQRAVALAPRNAVSLAYLGRLKLEQTNYNEAASLLSRAAQILPEDPDIQSVLGVALGGQGLRQPAETALRRALLLKPNSSYAHYNLAVIYLGQQPPFVELARWHYQKARSLGLAADSNFEKSLEAKRAALPR